MVKISPNSGGSSGLGNASKSSNGNASGGYWLPMLGMMSLGCSMALFASHVMYSHHHPSRNAAAAAATTTTKTAAAAVVVQPQASKDSISGAMAVDNPETGTYYDSMFKHPLQPFEDRLKSLPDAPEVPDLGRPQGAGGALQQRQSMGRISPASPYAVIDPADAENNGTSPNLSISFLQNVLSKRSDTKEAEEDDASVAPRDSGNVFDCDDKVNGKCVYFYPSHFFMNDTIAVKIGEEDGLNFRKRDQYAKGSEYYYLLEQMEDLLKERKLYLNMPYIGLWTMTFTPDHINPVTKAPFPHQNVTFIHIHKTGGTTVVRHANSQMKTLTGRSVSQFRVYMWQWMVGMNFPGVRPADGGPILTPARLRGGNNPQTRQRLQKLLFEKAVDHLKHATRFRPSSVAASNAAGRTSDAVATTTAWRETDHELFAVVRDPLDRFVSAIGQAMGAMGSTKNGVAAQLKADCINSERYTLEASRFTLQCIVDQIKQRGFFFEIHFTPQAVETAFATQMLPDTPVALFHMSDIQDVLAAIGCNPEKKVREGQGGKYRPAAVLQDMSVDDFTPELTQQVCELYRVDVIMMRTLGHEVPKCDPYVPGGNSNNNNGSTEQQ